MLNDLLGKKLFDRNISIKLENKELKLIAVEITSRHKRSEIKCSNKLDDKKNKMCSKLFRTTYKMFILYKPRNDHAGSIKGMLKILKVPFL